MDQYFKDISKYPLLSPKEEYDLAMKYKYYKCEKSREKLITGNLRYVISIAKKYVGQGLPLEDLIEEGNIGLIKSLKEFDPEKGFKFITYAAWWIRQSILQALSESNRIIRIPANKTAALNKIRTIENELTQELEAPPTIEQIQEKVNSLVNVNVDVEKTILTTYNCLDLNAVDVNDREILDTIPDTSQPKPDHIIKRSSLQKELEKALKGFSQREKDVIYLYHGLGGISRPLTLEEIGQLLNITRERVRQIKVQVLKKLKERGKLKTFKEILWED